MSRLDDAIAKCNEESVWHWRPSHERGGVDYKKEEPKNDDNGEIAGERERNVAGPDR